MGFQVIQYQMQLNIGLNFFKIKVVLSNTNKQQTSRSLCDKKSIKYINATPSVNIQLYYLYSCKEFMSKSDNLPL